MFQNLKSKNAKKSNYHNMPEDRLSPSEGLQNFHSNPKSSSNSAQTTAPIKGNEGDRLVRCRVCGFPCDKERDAKQKEGSWAGLGVSFGEQLSAGTSIGDRRVPAAGVVATTVDQYYNRTIAGGCPCCGCFTYWMK